MNNVFHWFEKSIPFQSGETISAALRRAGQDDLGSAPGDMRARYFCGIGACQGCLVSINDGSAVEACLTPARVGMRLLPGLPAVTETCHD